MFGIETETVIGNGTAIEGAKVYYYEAGSTTVLETIYADILGTITKSNPTLTDINGQFTVFLDTAKTYDRLIKAGGFADRWDRGITMTLSISNKTADFTASLSGGLYLCDCSGGQIIAAIQDNTTALIGLQKTDESTNPVVITGSGGYSYSLTVQGETIWLAWDGTAWKEVNKMGGYE